MHPTIRDARASEIRELAALLASCFAEYGRRLPPGIWNAYRAEIGNLEERRAVSELIVASDGARLVGTVTFFPDATFDAHGWPQGASSLRLLAVDPAFRGMGIGRLLIEECRRRARALQVRSLGLHTADVMAAGIKLYERMGFVRAPLLDFDPHAHYEADPTATGKDDQGQTATHSSYCPVRGLAYVLEL
ncbi:MAG: GNAT family N-acetyltransferase [Actinomycetota bacterium]|nr:GNAT family N-acetyltransferase [Actinomycetota bacterium]